MELLTRYFPGLDEQQISQFELMPDLYREWNEKINVISRKDIDEIYLHHILHSLCIAKFTNFAAGTEVLDLGTGGGFPGIPLAIMFPDVKFDLIDGTGKKIKVVQAVMEALGLKNVEARHQRAEEIRKQQYDFVVSRAVASLDTLWLWSKPLIHQKHKNGLPNGMIVLKGGNIRAEIKALPKGTSTEFSPVTDFFKEEYFQEKYVVYVQR
jgi:16S rRNA (guanine527-N7)-methyltransferase